MLSGAIFGTIRAADSTKDSTNCVCDRYVGYIPNVRKLVPMEPMKIMEALGHRRRGSAGRDEGYHFGAKVVDNVPRSTKALGRRVTDEE